MTVDLVAIGIAMAAAAENGPGGAAPEPAAGHWLGGIPATTQEWFLVVLAAVCLLAVSGFILWGAWFVFAWMHEHLLDIKVRIQRKRLAIATDDAALADIARGREQRDQVHRAELEKIRSMMSDINAKVAAGFAMGPEIEARMQRLHDENARLTQEVAVTASTTATSSKASAQLVKDLVDEVSETLAGISRTLQSLPAETARTVHAAIAQESRLPADGERWSGLERRLDELASRTGQTAPAPSEVLERISAMHAQVDATLARMTGLLDPLARIQAIEASQHHLREQIASLQRPSGPPSAIRDEASRQSADRPLPEARVGSTLDEVTARIRQVPQAQTAQAGADPATY